MPLDFVQSIKSFFASDSETATPDTELSSNKTWQSNNPTITEQPQLSYMWEVGFQGIFSEDAKNLKFYAVSTAMPAVINEPIRRWYAGREYIYSGKDTSPRIFRLTMWDNQRLEAYGYFYKWLMTMNDPNERRKVTPVNYLRDISLKLKDTTDGFVTQEAKFIDCFPSELSETPLVYTSSEIFTFDVMFSFSRREFV